MGTFNDGDSGSSIRTKINTAIQKTEGSSAISTIDVDGGAIDGVTLGTNSAVTEAQVDNININGNTISSTNTNGDVTIDPNGTGDVNVGNFKFDADQTVGAGQDNYVLTYDNSGGKISLEAAGGGGGGDPDLYRDNASSATTPSATGANAVAIGSAATAGGAGPSVAIGFEANASGHAGTAIGDNATASGTRGVAFQYSTASGVNGFAGVGTHASATYGAIGQQSVTLSQLGIASGNNSALLGGSNNTSSGVQSTAIGGEVNTAAGEASYAYGKRAKATEIGKYAYGHQLSGTVGATQGGMMILAAATTDATPTILRSNNNAASALNQIVAASDTCITFHGTLVAMQNGAQAYGGFKVEGLLVNDGGTTTLAASTVTAIQNSSGWTVALSADNTNNALAITCTGEASHNIRWVANISTSEVTYA